MAKTIYRICLIVCLAIAIGAGLFFYERQQQEREDQQEWTLVYQEETAGEQKLEQDLTEEAAWHQKKQFI